MTPVATSDRKAPPSRPGPKSPPLKVLVVCPTLEPGHRIPAPVEFANALVLEGAAVMFAAAVGPLRPHLARKVGYVLIDNAEQAPVKTAHELSAVIRHHHPDVVHAHGMRCALVTALAIKASRVHVARVMTHHTAQLRRMPGFLKGPFISHCADRFVAVSKALKEELESLGVPADRIRVDSGDVAHADRAARHSMAVYQELLSPPSQ
jgi:hypothetical protein